MEIKRDLYLGQRSLEICWEKSKIDEKVLNELDKKVSNEIDAITKEI